MSEPEKQAKGAMPARQRTLRARAAAHASWAGTVDRRARTQPGTNGFLARFERQVDPDQKLSPDLRRELALQARKAYMLQLALRSARSRSRNSASGPTA